VSQAYTRVVIIIRCVLNYRLPDDKLKMLRVYCKFSAGCQCRHALRPTTVLKAKQCI